MVIAVCRWGSSLLLPAHPRFLSLGRSAAEEPATEDLEQHGQQMGWLGADPFPVPGLLPR